MTIRDVNKHIGPNTLSVHEGLRLFYRGGSDVMHGSYVQIQLPTGFSSSSIINSSITAAD